MITGLTLLDWLLLAVTGAFLYASYLMVVYLFFEALRVRRLRRVRRKATATVSERTEPVVVRVDRRTWKEVRA